MTDRTSNNIAGNDVFELEAMRKESFSWHPCQVSLCSRGLALVVQYGDNDLEETLEDKQEILTRVRSRSTPLQGGECSSLQQGDHVLATQNLHDDPVFYDARVEQAIPVRHSKRNPCRCSFKVKWLHQACEETVTVPANAIMKLAKKSIDLNPTISAFFSKVESSNGLDTEQNSTFGDSLNWEMDINVLLEKQIEEISNSTDASKEKISKNFMFGLEVDIKGQSHGMSSDGSLKDQADAIHFLNDLEGSTRSENKQQMETIFDIVPSFVSSVQEKFTGSRSPLSPLAARAALASLRSEFPQKAELSVKSNVDRSANTDDFLLTVSATLGGRSPKLESITKNLFPTSNAPTEVNGIRKKNKKSEKKTSQPSETRLTRAQIQRNNGMHKSTNTKVTELRSSTQRVTRSAANRAETTEVEEYNVDVEEDTHTKCIEFSGPQNCLSDDSENEESDLETDVSVAEDVTKHNYPKRSKRSVTRGEAERNIVQPKLKSKETNASESNEMDLFVENVSTKRNKSSETVPHKKITPTCTENVAGTSQGIKRKSASSKTQEAKRFSPRLKLLPRTRSQHKA